MLIVMLGRPGAGKGTQIARVAARLGLDVVATSDVLRRLADVPHPLGRSVRDIMHTGGLVPDEVVVPAVAEVIRAGSGDVVLDGFPRTVAQCEALDDMLPDGVDLAIELVVSSAEVLARVRQRLVCPQCAAPVAQATCPRCRVAAVRRPDDDEEVVLRRLWTYERETAPVTRWFADRGVLVPVRGTGPAEDVTQRILAALDRSSATG